MDLHRIARHLMTGSRHTRRAFSRKSLDAIETAVGEAEQTHAGEIRFAVEGSLPLGALIAGETARARAVELFSVLRIWDTEHNNGVLVYVLLADRAVEIVADRGISARIGQHEWDEVCDAMRVAFAKGEFERGALQGLRAIAGHMVRHFGSAGVGGSELPNEPVVL